MSMTDRTVFVGLCLAFVVGTRLVSAQTVPGTPADVQVIRQLVAAHASSAQKDDVDGMVATQHEDVDERLDDGHHLVGRAAVAKFYSSIVSSGPHRLAHIHPPESIKIRFLTPEVAFVDVESTSMTGSGPRTPYFLVVTKVAGKWGVAEVRNGVPVE
jgi:hypothetical protein